MKSYNKILLINFGGIGDEILFLPVISSVKKQYPNSYITLCLESRSKSFSSLTNLVDNYFCVDIKTKNKYFEMLKLCLYAIFGRYDIVISSGSNPLISILLFLTGIKIRVGYDINFLSKKLLTHAVKLNKNQYAALMYYDLVKCITDIPFELPKIEIKEMPKEKNSVLVHPGVSKISIKKGIIKTINAQIWAEIIIGLLKKGKKVSLVGGKDDIECIERIRNYIKNEDLTNFNDLSGTTQNIKDLAILIKRNEVLLCSDSAPMHVGVATDTKTFAIFGPTNDETLLPKNNKFIAIKNNAKCRPCLWEKRQTTCNELICLKFNVEEIIDDRLL